MFKPSKRSKQRFFNFAENEIIDAFERWHRANFRKTRRYQRDARIRRMAERASRLRDERERQLWFATSASSDIFYSSHKWKTLRFQAIQKYGRKCFSCGITPDEGGVIQVDHVKPRFTWPELAFDIENLQILCSECNIGKGLHSTKVIRRTRAV